MEESPGKSCREKWTGEKRASLAAISTSLVRGAGAEVTGEAAKSSFSPWREAARSLQADYAQALVSALVRTRSMTRMLATASANGVGTGVSSRIARAKASAFLGGMCAGAGGVFSCL